jgi:hypothetical protein
MHLYQKRHQREAEEVEAQGCLGDEEAGEGDQGEGGAKGEAEGKAVEGERVVDEKGEAEGAVDLTLPSDRTIASSNTARATFRTHIKASNEVHIDSLQLQKLSITASVMHSSRRSTPATITQTLVM